MCDSANRDGVFPLEEEKELISRAKAGDIRAKEMLWERLQESLRLIVHSFLKNKYEYENFDDLIVAANMALLDVYEGKKGNYDPARNTRLMAYAKWYVREAIRVEYWRLKGFPEDLAKHVGEVLRARYKFIEQNKCEPDSFQIEEIAKEDSGVPIKTTRKIIELLKVRTVPIERNSEDGSAYQWLSSEDVRDEIEESTVSVKRMWDFQEEDIGFINARMAGHFKGKWKKEDTERYNRFVLAIESPSRCLRRRLVFANGSRGMLDLSALEEINEYSSGSDVYNRRTLWKNHSPF